MTSYGQAHAAMLLCVFGFGGYVLLPWVLGLALRLLHVFP